MCRRVPGLSRPGGQSTLGALLAPELALHLRVERPGYASRRRGWWRRRGVVLAGAATAAASDVERVVAPWPALRARRRRWAEMLRRVFAVEVEVCPSCGGEMRILAFVTEPSVVTCILAHLARRGVDARAGPWAGVAG